MKKTFTYVNESGFSLKDDDPNVYVKELKAYEESGAVLFWISIRGKKDEEEIMQYLTPEEAMKIAASLRNCAIQALEKLAGFKNGTE